MASTAGIIIGAAAYMAVGKEVSIAMGLEVPGKVVGVVLAVVLTASTATACSTYADYCDPPLLLLGGCLSHQHH